MRVPLRLAEAFGASFEELISQFAFEQKLLPTPDAIQSHRFLSRSVVPHILKLSQLFNRIEPVEPEVESEKPRPRRKPLSQPSAKGLAPYWKESSRPENLRLAYFLYFMPCNLFRIASIWTELARMGYRWKANPVLRAIEFGAGPASGAAGISAAEKNLPPSQATGLPLSGNWALIEQDRAMLQLGQGWAERYFADQGRPEWGIRPFHRKLDVKQGFLPPTAPKFNLWLMSFFLNEFNESPEVIARQLISSWERHLEEEGLVILAEPALKFESRKLLEIRKSILIEKEKQGLDWLQLLLPCMGHQTCEALSAAEDWCHEEVTWWRPSYFRLLDKMAELDRKTLPFSYLVFTKSKRTREEILPALAQSPVASRLRLVSPAHWEGKDLEFFVCGQEGKRRARFRPGDSDELERGDVLLKPELRGDVHSTRITATGGIVNAE